LEIFCFAAKRAVWEYKRDTGRNFLENVLQLCSMVCFCSKAGGDLGGDEAEI
jgi:hypothetical protein